MGMTAAIVSAVAAVGGVAAQQDSARKARHAAQDAARLATEQQQAADTSAAQSANAAIAMRKRALAANALTTGAGQPAGSGRATLGG